MSSVLYIPAPECRLFFVYLFLNVSPLAGVGHVGLGLPELGQVEGGNLLRLLDLLLVAPDLGLQLINQTLHKQYPELGGYIFWSALHLCVL
jgi:hypothetical protein